MTDRDAAAPEGVGVPDLPEVSMHTVTEPTIGRQLLTARRRAWIAALLGAALLAPAGAAFAAAHDTTLVSRASGPAGASANAGSIAPPAVSADGRFVAFWSNATNLSPDDSDTLYDLYRRDLASDTTVLVSRASGKFGPKAAGTFDFGGPSDLGRRPAGRVHGGRREPEPGRQGRPRRHLRPRPGLERDDPGVAGFGC